MNGLVFPLNRSRDRRSFRPRTEISVLFTKVYRSTCIDLGVCCPLMEASDAESMLIFSRSKHVSKQYWVDTSDMGESAGDVNIAGSVRRSYVRSG